MGLIPVAKAQSIAAGRIGSQNVRFNVIELNNEAKSKDFRPVFSLECVSGGRLYEIKIDAMTGSVIAFN